MYLPPSHAFSARIVCFIFLFAFILAFFNINQYFYFVYFPSSNLSVIPFSTNLVITLAKIAGIFDLSQSDAKIICTISLMLLEPLNSTFCFPDSFSFCAFVRFCIIFCQEFHFYIQFKLHKQLQSPSVFIYIYHVSLWIIFLFREGFCSFFLNSVGLLVRNSFKSLLIRKPLYFTHIVEKSFPWAQSLCCVCILFLAL